MRSEIVAGWSIASRADVRQPRGRIAQERVPVAVIAKGEGYAQRGAETLRKQGPPPKRPCLGIINTATGCSHPPRCEPTPPPDSPALRAEHTGGAPDAHRRYTGNSLVHPVYLRCTSGVPPVYTLWEPLRPGRLAEGLPGEGKPSANPLWVSFSSSSSSSCSIGLLSITITRTTTRTMSCGFAEYSPIRCVSDGCRLTTACLPPSRDRPFNLPRTHTQTPSRDRLFSAIA